MLVIGKPAEFGPDALPVRGQCQPHTKGWRLRFFHRGTEEFLHQDTFYVCAQIQRSCAGLSPEEARTKARAMATEFANSLNVQETQKMAASSGASDSANMDTVDLRDDESEARPGSGTTKIPREEMEREARKRRKGFTE